MGRNRKATPHPPSGGASATFPHGGRHFTSAPPGQDTRRPSRTPNECARHRWSPRECCRRCPGGCGLADGKAADSNITYSCFGREEAFTTHIDFHIFRVRIFSLEIGVNDCFIRFGILFGIPFVDRIFRNPAAWIHFSAKTLIQSYCLTHGATVQIYAAGMFVCLCKIPVTIYCSRIWVIRTERTICHTTYPGVVLIRCPGFNLLCTGNHSTQWLYTAIGDPGIFTSGIDWIYIFTVIPGTLKPHHPVVRSLQHH